MGDNSNSRGTQFKPGNPGGGRPKGSRNRGTLLKRWMEMPAKFRNPETLKMVDGTVEEKMDLAILAAAMSGNTRAWKEVKDAVYGKQQKNIHVTGNVFEEVMKQFGDEEGE